MKICGLIRLNMSQLPKVMQVLMVGNVNPNSASVDGEKSGQGTDPTLQDEIGEPVKRNVDVSEMTTARLEDQSTANDLHNPPSLFSSVFSGRWPETLDLVWQTLESKQKMVLVFYLFFLSSGRALV